MLQTELRPPFRSFGRSGSRPTVRLLASFRGGNFGRRPQCRSGLLRFLVPTPYHVTRGVATTESKRQPERERQGAYQSHEEGVQERARYADLVHGDDDAEATDGNGCDRGRQARIGET